MSEVSHSTALLACVRASGSVEQCLGPQAVIKGGGLTCAVQVIGPSPDRHDGSGASLTAHASFP